MFTSGVTAAVLSVPRAVTIAYYLSTLIVVGISVSLGIATLRARDEQGSGRSRSTRNFNGGRRTRGSTGRLEGSELVSRCQHLLVAATEQVSAAINQKQRDRL